MQQVKHPNVVRLHELVSEGGQWFFTMELLDGAQSFTSWVRPAGARLAPDSGRATEVLSAGSMERVSEKVRAFAGDAPDANENQYPAHLATQPLSTARMLSNAMGSIPPSVHVPPLDVVRLRDALRQLTIGVSAIHAAGKLHRDIKPNNVLVTAQGRVTLVDFGLTLNPGDSNDHCTPAYMAPEQVHSSMPQQASDWYSIGVMLYEALTGDVPFAPLYSDFDRAMQAKCTTDPSPPIAVNPAVPQDLSILCMALLERDPTKRAGADEVLKALSERTRRSLESVARPAEPKVKRFWGRTQELAALKQAFADSVAAQVVLFVTGELGVGKSELVAQGLHAFAADGAVVLRGHCYERETVPFKAWDTIIDRLSYVWASLPAEQAAAIVPPDAGLLLHMFPVLKRVGALARELVAAAPPLPPQEQRLRAFNAIREVFRRITQFSALVLVVDDFQWADQDSIQLLAALQGAVNSPKLLFVATVRKRHDGAHEADATLDTWRTQLKDVRELALDVLSEADALQLAGALLGSDSKIDPLAIVKEAGCHPFYIEELVKVATESGQVALGELERALHRRMKTISPLGRRLLDMLAVAGQPVAREAVASALGSEISNVVEEVEVLQGEHLIRTDGMRRNDKVSTYHDRVRHAVLHTLTPQTLRYIHEQLASTFETMPEIDPEIVAEHWIGAGNEAKGIHFGLLAGAQALTKLAFARAVRLYSRIIERWPSNDYVAVDVAGATLAIYDVWERLGDALASGRQAQQAAAAYQAASRLAADDDRARLLQLSADQLLRCGQIDAGQSTLAPILKAAGVPLPRSRGKAVMSLLANRFALAMRGGFERGLRNAEHGAGGAAMPLVLQRKLELCWTTLVDLFSVDQLLGILFYSRYIGLAFRSKEPLHLCRAAATEAIYITANNGSEAKVDERMADARRIAARSGHPAAEAFTIFAGAMVAFLRGDWRSLQAACLRFMEATDSQKHHFIYERNMLHQVALWAMCLCGELVEVGAYSASLLREAKETGDLYAQMSAKAGLPNIVWLAKGDIVSARTETTSAAAQWSQRGYHLQHLFDLYSQVQIDLYLGDASGAQTRLDNHGAALRKSGLLRIQMNRALLAELEARVLLRRLGGAMPASEIAMVRRKVKRLVARLRGERRAWITSMAGLLDAQLAGDQIQYKRAAEALLDLGLKLPAHAAMLQVGGDDAEVARRFFVNAGVANPEVFAKVFCPIAPTVDQVVRPINGLISNNAQSA